MASATSQLDHLARGDARADRLFRWTVAAAGVFGAQGATQRKQEALA